MKDLTQVAEDLKQLLKVFQLPEQAGDNVVDIHPGSTGEAARITNPPPIERVEIRAETG